MTPRQARYIAMLCCKLGIKDEPEQNPMPDGEAGRLIRELEAKVRGGKDARH